MKKEEWKKIKGFKNYMVSNLGRVKRLKFTSYYSRLDKKCFKINEEIILKEITKTESGLTRVVRIVSDNGVTKHRKIHRLVGEAFFGTPEVRHKTLNFDDNSVYNLIAKKNINNCKYVKNG